MVHFCSKHGKNMVLHRTVLESAIQTLESEGLNPSLINIEEMCFVCVKEWHESTMKKSGLIEKVEYIDNGVFGSAIFKGDCGNLHEVKNFCPYCGRLLEIVNPPEWLNNKEKR